MSARRGTLDVLCVATTTLLLDIAVLNPAVSHLAASLHARRGDLEWVMAADTVAVAVAALTGGSMADRFGRRQMFTSGLRRINERARRRLAETLSRLAGVSLDG
jgi:MFS family permease